MKRGSNCAGTPCNLCCPWARICGAMAIWFLIISSCLCLSSARKEKTPQVTRRPFFLPHLEHAPTVKAAGRRYWWATCKHDMQKGHKVGLTCWDLQIIEQIQNQFSLWIKPEKWWTYITFSWTPAIVYVVTLLILLFVFPPHLQLTSHWRVGTSASHPKTPVPPALSSSSAAHVGSWHAHDLWPPPECC